MKKSYYSSKHKIAELWNNVAELQGQIVLLNQNISNLQLHTNDISTKLNNPVSNPRILSNVVGRYDMGDVTHISYEYGEVYFVTVQHFLNINTKPIVIIHINYVKFFNGELVNQNVQTTAGIVNVIDNNTCEFIVATASVGSSIVDTQGQYTIIG